MSDPLETDSVLTAIHNVLLAAETSEFKQLPEATAANIVVWHHGEMDPDEDIRAAIGKSKGVSILIYDLGGDETSNESDTLSATIVIELFVDPTKRNRKVHPELRLAGQIRDALMRKIHHHPSLRNVPAFADTRVRGYTPLTDPDFTAYRINVTRSFYLQID